MEKDSFAFGMGSRTCLGRNITFLEIGKPVPELVRGGDPLQGNKVWKTMNKWFVKPYSFDVM
jgi:hypothetical protein